MCVCTNIPPDVCASMCACMCLSVCVCHGSVDFPNLTKYYSFVLHWIRCWQFYGKLYPSRDLTVRSAYQKFSFSLAKHRHNAITLTINTFWIIDKSGKAQYLFCMLYLSLYPPVELENPHPPPSTTLLATDHGERTTTNTKWWNIPFK